jgi:ADP-heptose:LPS heptosyltransferase
MKVMEWDAEVFDKNCANNLLDILVVRRNRLGDAAITCLILGQLLSQYRNARISVITNNYAAAVYREFLPALDVFEMPSSFWGIAYSALFQSRMKKLRSRRFDLAINCSGSFSTKAIFTLLFFRAKFKIAVGNPKRKFWSVFLDNALPLDESLRSSHQVEKIVSLFRRANFDLSLPSPSVQKMGESERFLLFPECNRRESTWPLSNWLCLREELIERGFLVTLCGSSDLEASVNINVSSPKNTKELIQLIRDYDHIVSSEGGVSHLAALAGKRITSISGVNIKKIWFPWSFDARLIEREGNVVSITVEEILMIIQRNTELKDPSVFGLSFKKVSNNF